MTSNRYSSAAEKKTAKRPPAAAKGTKKNSASSTKKSKIGQFAGFMDGFIDSIHSLSTTTKAILGVVMVAALAFGVINLTRMQLSINEKQKILDDLNTQIAQQELDNQELERKLNSDLKQYIEEYAKDKLDMTSPGERVYINTAGN